MGSPLSKKDKRKIRCIDCARKLDEIEGDAIAPATEFYLQKLVNETKRNFTSGDPARGPQEWACDRKDGSRAGGTDRMGE